MRPTGDYWFLAKRYGWGWGLPATWQGWVVMAIWLGVVLVAVLFLRHQHPFAFAAIFGSSTAVFVWVCYLTGEPPKWRWGD
jgi:hypothetical protein